MTCPARTATVLAPPARGHRSLQSFLGANALHDEVTFRVEPGEVLALIGENGAGKSTLIRISGAHRPDAGEVLINGAGRHRRPRAAEDLGIATVYQELSLFPDLSMAENLVFEDIPRAGRHRLARRTSLEAAEFLAGTSTCTSMSAPRRDLQHCGEADARIAKALHRRAQIVILDEPIRSARW